MNDDPIRTCPFCNDILTLDKLVSDPLIRPIGMIFGKGSFEHAFYCFQHETQDCGTSFLVNVLIFSPYLSEPIPKERLTLTESCERHCVNIKDLSECKQPCLFAPFRRFLIKMLETKGKTKSVNSFV
jgi:hypothetical protein